MSFDHTPTPLVKLTHPEWSKNAVIYQINTRQFTPEGTFKAVEAHLPRLKDLGADILWLMPIHEIGQKNRKGTLGSPYAVKDYYSVNPEFGALEDLKHFVRAAHELGMHVILDFVPNHTAWDSVLAGEHPDWFSRNWKGDFHPTPWWDWSDIIDLDYSKVEVRKYISAAMQYWVREADIDGYRCDVAGFVPTDFWNVLRKELDAIKPVFMLAEWEARDLHAEAFDMTYAWTWYDTMLNIAKGEWNVSHLFIYYSWNEKAYPFDIMRMLFVSNHDKNAWNGTQFEQFGDATEAVIALSVISEGMPLVYNSQEAGEPKRLSFFEKDPIEWKEHPIGALYKKLFALKKKNTALWNAAWGARMIHVPNSAPLKVFSFVRQNEKDKVFAVFNFSAEPQSVTFEESPFHGKYVEYMSGRPAELSAASKIEIQPWDYRIFVK
ncbi:MAG: alpha-glucosidase C-terminal domain-containing protein [Chloroflexi bacterium]|nr:alpha-glucosidase C-terminal domain-containing protein [Chloroflexota bacterium]